MSAPRLVQASTGRDTDARWADPADERLIAVPADAAKRPHRLVAGRSKRPADCLAGEDCVSAVVFGPNGSGKTVGLIIPNTLEWQGSVVMTTAKPQDLTPVLGARARLGPGLGGGAGRRTRRAAASWSPVDYATDADAADRMAGWLVDSSGMTGDPRARPWNAQARKYLKGLLLAAKLSGRGMKGFVEWAYDGELASDHVSQILTEHGYVDVLREYRSTWRIHEEGKGSVMFTAFGLADTYNRPGVLESAQHSDFAASDLFGDRPATLLLVTPQSEVERFTPYFTALDLVRRARGGAAGGRAPGDRSRHGCCWHSTRRATSSATRGCRTCSRRLEATACSCCWRTTTSRRSSTSSAGATWHGRSSPTPRCACCCRGSATSRRSATSATCSDRPRSRSARVRPDRTDGDHEARRSTARRWPRSTCCSRCPPARRILLYENLPPVKIRLRRWFEDRRLSPPRRHSFVQDVEAAVDVIEIVNRADR